MRKAPLVLAIALLGGFVAVDRVTLSAAAAEAHRVVLHALGTARPPAPAPELAHVVVTETTVPPPVSTEPEEALPPGDEPLEMADDWAEIAPASDDESEDAPAEPKAAEPEGPPVLVSIARETWIFAEPRWRSRRLGYLRAGATVERSDEAVGHRGCSRGWYRIAPHGYVCLNKTATLDAEHPVAVLSARRPNMAGLPYTYAMSRFPTPPLYARLPSEAQQKRVEPERHYHLRKYDRLQKDADFVAPPPAEPIPSLLEGGAVIPPLGGEVRGSETVLLRHARVRSGFALLGSYEVDGRQFGLTTEMAAIPLDRTRVIAPSTFGGVVLSDEFTLPVAFVRSKFAHRYEVHADTGAFAVGAALPHRSVVALTGNVKQRGEHHFLEARDGSWVRGDRVVRVDSFKQPPKWASQGKQWIDVSILRQSLVAYEGLKPVFATLVSTGAGGIQDPEKTHATIQGTFLIHTKHISVTMDGDDRGDEFDLRDVPFVQYFTEGYALHGAYWHDDFGTPRSHGCINLAPRDAAWLFNWTAPEVPAGWHAALSLAKGTIVYVHP